MGNEYSHLYRSHIATGETKDLTPIEGPRVNILAFEHHYARSAAFHHE